MIFARFCEIVVILTRCCALLVSLASGLVTRAGEAEMVVEDGPGPSSPAADRWVVETQRECQSICCVSPGVCHMLSCYTLHGPLPAINCEKRVKVQVTSPIASLAPSRTSPHLFDHPRGLLALNEVSSSFGTQFGFQWVTKLHGMYVNSLCLAGWNLSFPQR